MWHMAFDVLLTQFLHAAHHPEGESPRGVVIDRTPMRFLCCGVREIEGHGHLEFGGVKHTHIAVQTHLQ
jgi:hypothetical protein